MQQKALPASFYRAAHLHIADLSPKTRRRLRLLKPGRRYATRVEQSAVQRSPGNAALDDVPLATQSVPFPLHYVQTDNGLEFQQRFHAKCGELGLEHFYIHKSSPNDNAVIERSFRTDEEEFFFWLEQAPQDHLELNTWYQAYLVKYNTIRPHMGINMLTPKEAIDLYQKS